MSSSHAYLHPILGSRPNLEVRTGCWVKRVELDGDRRARAVEYLTPDLLTQAQRARAPRGDPLAPARSTRRSC